MSAFPERMDWLAWVATATSSIKWISLVMGHVIMAIVAIAALWVMLKDRIKSA